MAINVNIGSALTRETALKRVWWGRSNKVALSRTTALIDIVSPNDGDAYILPDDDISNPNEIAIWDDNESSYIFLVPEEGWTAYVEDDAEYVIFLGSMSGWVIGPARGSAMVVGNLIKALSASGGAIEDADVAVSTDTTLAANSDAKLATEKAVKTYVDSAIAAALLGIGQRGTVRVATTADITISTALNNGDSIDGVTLSTGDLVLVKSQSAQEQNGIYVVGVTPARSSNFDTYDEHPGALIVVQEGSTFADTIWFCTSNKGGTLDTTAIEFSTIVLDSSIAIQDTAPGSPSHGDLWLEGTTAALFVYWNDGSSSQWVQINGTPDLSNYIRTDTTSNLTTGYTATAYNAGTQSSGTYTPDPSDGSMHRYVNGGAHTLAPPSTGVGDSTSIIIQVTNNGSAGTITVSGFTKVTGDAITTVDGQDFMFYIIVVNGFSHLNVQALQ